LISADASEKVNSLEELGPFVEDAKKSGRGMRGDILEIQGMPLAFWSHLDALNAEFGTGVYEKQYVLLRGWMGIRRGRIGRCCSGRGSRLSF